MYYDQYAFINITVVDNQYLSKFFIAIDLFTLKKN